MVVAAEEEIAASGEVLVDLRAGWVGGAGEAVIGERLERDRINHARLRGHRRARTDTNDAPRGVEGE